MSPRITTAKQFGEIVRERRKSLNMTQKQLALAANVGERFIVDLEQGKETCQLGKALRVAKGVGVKLMDGRDEQGIRESGGYDLGELS